MVQFLAYDPSIEVNGQTVLSVVKGMQSFRNFALQILRDCGIDDPQPQQWYSQQAWLDAFRTIADRVGERTLRAIGKRIPESADFPDSITDITSALASINVAYHMNHRRNGRVMFDPETGNMTEGIGHYHFEPVDERTARMRCDNPYPCAFDHGIIESMATQFKPESVLLVRVTHAPGACRASGGDVCVYDVRW